jgi:hypothetical protein
MQHPKPKDVCLSAPGRDLPVAEAGAVAGVAAAVGVYVIVRESEEAPLQQGNSAGYAHGRK